jgi:hypothetical protein
LYHYIEASLAVAAYGGELEGEDDLMLLKLPVRLDTTFLTTLFCSKNTHIQLMTASMAASIHATNLTRSANPTCRGW